MPVVDIDFYVGGAGSARGDEKGTRGATDFGCGGGEGAVSETDVEETKRRGSQALLSMLSAPFTFGERNWGEQA